MPASGIKRTERRQTIPLRKSDTEHLFDYFMYKQILKTLPSERDVTTGVQHVMESTTTTTTTDNNKNTLPVEEQQPFKRTNSYRKATNRLTVYDNTEVMVHSPFKITEDKVFKKEDYNYRKYKTLPPESDTLRRASQRKRKSSEAQMNKNNNNNNNKTKNHNEKSPHSFQRSGSIASNDSDSEDDVSINTIDRKKKSAFQRAKERIFQTFSKQKKNDEEKKKNKPKVKKSAKKKTKRNHGKDDKKSSEAGVVVMDEHGHCTSHVTQSRYGDVLVRREESMDVKDCVTPSSPGVHSESRTMVTDTRDLSTKSKPAPISKFQSLRRSIRRKFSDASKSPKEENRSGPSLMKMSNSGSDQGTRQMSLSSPSNPCPMGQFRQPANTVTKVFEAIISQDADQDVPCGRRTRSAARGGAHAQGDRSRLQLKGLVPCHTISRSLPSSGNFEADVETDTHTKYVKSPDGYMDVVTDTYESVRICPMDVDDVEPDCPNDNVDGFEPVAKKGRGSSRRKRLLESDNSLPFDELTQEEKNKRIESVANRLAVIADNYVTRAESSQSDNECQSPTDPLSGSRKPPDRLNSIERDLIFELRREGDRLSETINMPSVIMPIAMQLVKETDQYNRFTKVVESSLGGTVGWHNVAMYFYVTKAAVHMAGAGGAVALKLKDMALQYFSDRFAGWITDRGGWDSVLEETDSELD
ncbi:uncharacterized protein LOC117327380 [Pecten maximus]|uniref:uncharacterized protein LOC117327380 n=1 Tax=Pecten maximus TaxID=6579 RepID=UPI0014587AEF|nr:uncharacterized protein LOC117327380 [Pecten maximus]XP_033740221.1 uncharacterized protein LOC117327380 [Pecten maximus]